MSKNGFQLTKTTSRRGYEWWWHSFVATNTETGELKPFFIEYFVINPGLWDGKIKLGQEKTPSGKGPKPCYAMIKAGTWGNDKAQLHNFYGIPDFEASRTSLSCKIGHNVVTESSLHGSIHVPEQHPEKYPERMSDAGSMSWNLKIEKQVKFDAGFGSSKLFNRLRAFQMYWHVEGMKCLFSGEVVYNQQTFRVHPETSYGYQDKNWGSDYTNPWIWLNCNNFRSKSTGEPVDASFDLGGGCPKVFGIALKKRILTAFYYRGEFMEFNFSKFWLKSKQYFHTTEDENYVYWTAVSENRKFKIEVNFRCEKSKLLNIHYENPDGKKYHKQLWNGGHAEGNLKFFKRKGKLYSLVEELTGNLGGCEYGTY